MLTAFFVAAIASAALPMGAALGIWTKPPKALVAALLGFASGALITAVAIEMFLEAFSVAPWQSAFSFLVGATVFILVDSWLEKKTAKRKASGAAIGFALMLGVVLDGVPENLAMGISLSEGNVLTLLVAVFVSNLPEALVGAQKIRQAGLSASKTMWLWTAVGVILMIPVLLGFGFLQGVSTEITAWPLAFAAGAVLASLADTLMPEAYAEGGPKVAFATALGFLVSFCVAMI